GLVLLGRPLPVRLRRLHIIVFHRVLRRVGPLLQGQWVGSQNRRVYCQWIVLHTLWRWGLPVAVRHVIVRWLVLRLPLISVRSTLLVWIRALGSTLPDSVRI